MRSFEYDISSVLKIWGLDAHSESFMEVHMTNITTTRCGVGQTDFER
jgi:hypothetical protein